MYYIKSSNPGFAKEYMLYRKNGTTTVPVYKQRIQQYTFSNYGSLTSDGHPQEVVKTNLYSGDRIEGVHALVDFSNAIKRYYIRIDAQCSITSAGGTSAGIDLSAILYCNTSYGDLNIYAAELQGNNIVFKSDWGSVIAHTLSSTENIKEVYVRNYTVYHAGIVTQGGLERIGVYTDFIPLEQLPELLPNSSFADSASTDIIAYLYTDASFDTCLKTHNRADFTEEQWSSYFLKTTMNANYVIFCSSNKSGSLVIPVTQSAALPINDAVSFTTYWEGYYMRGGELEQNDDWSCSDFLHLKDLRNCAEGWCVRAEDGLNDASTKMEFFDADDNWLSSVTYEDAQGALSVEDIYSFAEYTPTAEKVVFNLDNEGYAQNSDLAGMNVIFVDGRCKRHSNTPFLVKYTDGSSWSDFSTPVMFSHDTHAYRTFIKSASCLEMGSSIHTCVNCGYSFTDSYTPLKAHSWDNIAYVWDEDSYAHTQTNKHTCVAKCICRGNGAAAHEESVEGVVTHVVETEPSLTTDESIHEGIMSCTATFSGVEWAPVTQTKRFIMFPRLASPQGGVGLAGVNDDGEAEYTIDVYNPNPRFSDYEGDRVMCYVTLYDEDGAELHSTSLEIFPKSYGRTSVTLSSSLARAYRYSMFLRYDKKSDSFTVTDFVS